jgi:serine/threonine protein kinase/tetratricopeptide (TPR) repeat protein
MQSGDLIAQRFEIEAPIGAGGMGTVYRARDRHTGQRVAVKVLHERGASDMERFARESQLLAELGHPGIVRYVAHGRPLTGDPYLAMEWLEGKDLSDRIAQSKLTVAETLGLGARVADALAAAHHRGVVHRDIKPANLFLPHGEIDRVKLLDFGVARTGSASFVTTRSGAMVGTLGYMSPEQARGDKDIDARADVFALGCVLYECLHGQPAFAGEHAMGLLGKILLVDPPSLRESHPEIPLALDTLLARMLAKDKRDRPTDGGAVSACIAELTSQRDPAALEDASFRASPSSSPAGPGDAVRPAALTGGEQRVLSVLLVGSEREHRPAQGNDVGSRDADGPADPSSAPTVPSYRPHDARPRLDAVAKVHGASLEWLADGSMVATLTSGRDSATDQAARAARCALALRAVLTSVPMALGTGRGIVAGKWPVGDVLDRAAALMRQAKGRKGLSGRVAVDEVTAGLLDARFEVEGAAPELWLVGERPYDEARTLLGKPTPCVGRERELAMLQALYDECVADQVARVALITAAAGVGKSRLRHELVRNLAQHPSRPQIWYARGESLSAGSSFAVAARMLRREVQILDGEPVGEQQARLLARVGRRVKAPMVRRVTDFLAELIGVPIDDSEASRELRAARQDSTLLGDQMRRAYEDFVQAECAVQPLLMLIEDVHWGDLPTVRLIDSVLRNLHGAPLMVIGFGRPEVHQLFPSLWAERDVTDLRLARLSKRAAEKLVREVLSDPKLRERALSVVDRAGGNAFYIEELIRAVAEGKGDALPPTVLAMVQGRLEALDHEARRVLRAASVFGEAFWTGAVAALLGEANRAWRAQEWLSELAEREIVVKRAEAKFPGEAEYAFRNAIVREAASAMLTDADRVVGHRLAAEWLLQAGERDARVLAEHFERGGERAAAAVWYRRAAEQALGGSDVAAAIPFADQAVSCGVSGEALGALRLVQAEAHRWRGEFSQAEQRGEEALAALARPSALWFQAQGELVVLAGRLGHVGKVVRIVEELRATPVAPALRDAHLGAAARAVVHAVYLGRLDLADALLQWLAAQIAHVEREDGRVAARVHQARAVRALADGDPTLFLDQMTRAAEHFERLDDLRNTCLQRANLGPGYSELGAYKEAEQVLREAAATAERMGLGNVAIAAKTNLAFALARSGALDEAEQLAADAARAAELQGDRRMEGGARNFLAMILAKRNDLSGAAQHARAAVDVLSVAPPLRAYALGTLASILLQAANPSAPVTAERRGEALAAAREAEALLASLSGTDEGESLVRLVFAEALWANGEDSAARGAIAKADARIRERASKIADGALKASFLEQVEENRRTLALVKEWG